MSLGPRLFCSYCRRWVVTFISKKGVLKKDKCICPLCNSDIDLNAQDS